MKYVIKWPAHAYRVDIIVHDELGRVAFIIKFDSWNLLGQKTWIYDCNGRFLGMMKKQKMHKRTVCRMFVGDSYIGKIKEAGIFSWPVLNRLDHQGWRIIADRSVKGRRVVLDQAGNLIMTITAVRRDKLWQPAFYIDVAYPEHALIAMMITMV